jgi:hypothetical protein
MSEFDTLCERYVGLLKRAANEGYPIGARETTARERAVTDWEAAAFLPTADLDMAVTLSHIETARETINGMMGAPIRPVHHRDGRETYGWRPHKSAETTGASPAADGDSPSDDHPSLFDAPSRQRAAAEEAGP